MKAINMPSPSHVSTHISMDQPSSSSSSSSLYLAAAPRILGGSSGGGGSSPAIDRHNPIITDDRRTSRTPPTSSHPSPFTPKPSPLQKQTPKKTPKKNAKKLIGLTKIRTNHHRHHHSDHHQIHALQKSASKPSDLITVKGGGDSGGTGYINPPESSRYLLDEGEDAGSDFLDGLSDFDPVLKLKAPFDQPINVSSSASHEVEAPKLLDGCKSSAEPPLPSPPSSSSSSDHQVVVLRVSLHCRGCEGKVRKHISRMQGVTSFNIDFAAKKVTVVGDVTPLEVLASISKVKTAQLWMPPSSGLRAMEVGTKKL